MENIIISTNYEYSEIIKKGIKEFNCRKYPQSLIFNKYREKEYSKLFGFYYIIENQVKGGIIASKKMEWLDIDILYVDEKYRGNKIGSQLINKAVEYCKLEKLIGIHLFTLNFQAKGFYEKQGFNLIAQIKDWPKGFTRYEFIKYISY